MERTPSRVANGSLKPPTPPSCDGKFTTPKGNSRPPLLSVRIGSVKHNFSGLVVDPLQKPPQVSLCQLHKATLGLASAWIPFSRLLVSSLLCGKIDNQFCSFAANKKATASQETASPLPQAWQPESPWQLSGDGAASKLAPMAVVVAIVLFLGFSRLHNMTTSQKHPGPFSCKRDTKGSIFSCMVCVPHTRGAELFASAFKMWSRRTCRAFELEHLPETRRTSEVRKAPTSNEKDKFYLWLI